MSKQRSPLGAFDQGSAAARAGKAAADNPYMPESERELWEAWAEGFDYEEGPRFVRAKEKEGQR